MRAFKAAVRAFAFASLGLLSAAAARAEDIVVTHYGSLLYGVPYAIAMEKGYFKEAGVDIKGILTSKGGGTSVRNMMAGDTLFAEVALPAALSAIKEGFNIKIISGGTNGRARSGSRVPARRSTSRPTSRASASSIRVRNRSARRSRSRLKSWDITAADVKMIAIGDFGAGLTALEHNKVDVAIIPEPIYSQKEKAGTKYKTLGWLDEKLPAYAQTVGIATDEAIAKNGPKLKAVIEARRRGVEFLHANRRKPPRSWRRPTTCRSTSRQTPSTTSRR